MSDSKQISDKIHLFDFDFTDQIRNHLYLIVDQDEAVLIDAHIGQAAEKVLGKIEEIIELDNLKTVLLTHGHMDHIGACPILEEKTNASIAAHIADAQYIEEPWTQFVTLYQDFNISAQAYQDFITIAGGRGVKVTKPLHDGDTITVGSLKLKIIHTPGHSPGSICIYEPETKTMFTGDVLTPSDWFSTMIGARAGVEDMLPGGLTLKDGVGAAKMIADAGADVIDVSGGLCGHIHPENRGPGFFIPQAADVKEAVDVPVIGVGGIKTSEEADEVIRSDKVDLVAIGRAILNDKGWAMRARSLC